MFHGNKFNTEQMLKERSLNHQQRYQNERQQRAALQKQGHIHINIDNSPVSQEKIPLEALQDVLRKNPQLGASLPEIREENLCEEENSHVEEEGWIRQPMGPGGPMGLILRYKNPLFRSGTAPMQRVILREEVIELQNNVPSLLKGRKWPTRRVAEAIAQTLGNGKPIQTETASGIHVQPPWNELCYAALCEIEGVQMMIINSEKKTINFSPEDIRVWKSDVPIFALTDDGKQALEWGGSARNENNECGTDESWPHAQIGRWFSKMEDAGWTIAWPTAEGTMEELREILEEANVPVQGRMKKDEMARRAGKAGAIATLSKWI